MKFKPTPEQIEIIKRCAVYESSPKAAMGSILLEPGVRFNTSDHTKPGHMNIALVTNETDSWNDTDLNDYGSWSEFRKGVELDPNGRGIFDFYLRRRGDDNRDLLGNVTVYINSHKMSYIDGYGHADPLWRIAGGYMKGVG